MRKEPTSWLGPWGPLRGQGCGCLRRVGGSRHLGAGGPEDHCQLIQSEARDRDGASEPSKEGAGLGSTSRLSAVETAPLLASRTDW